MINLPDKIKDNIFKFLDVGNRFCYFSKLCKELDDFEYVKIKKYYMIIEHKFNKNRPPYRLNMINFRFLFKRLYKLINNNYTVTTTFHNCVYYNGILYSNEIKSKKLMNYIL